MSDVEKTPPAIFEAMMAAHRILFGSISPEEQIADAILYDLGIR